MSFVCCCFNCCSSCFGWIGNWVGCVFVGGCLVMLVWLVCVGGKCCVMLRW